MRLQHQLHRAARIGQRRIVQRTFRQTGREAGGDKYPVPLARRDGEPLGQPHHYVAAGPRPAGFDEAEVAGGDFRVEREIELAQAAARAPGAELLTDRERSEEHTSELQSLMRNSYAVFCWT